MYIYLVRPRIELEEAYLDFYNEWGKAGEKVNPKVLRQLNPDNFKQMVHAVLEMSNPEKLPTGRVPETVYWLIDQNNRILGAVTIRHALTKRLLDTEGHIGAGIRPSERRKGYATTILKMTLDKMREMGFKQALVTCNEDNMGSEKAIVKNGGIRDHDFIEGHGNIVKRYWINL